MLSWLILSVICLLWVLGCHGEEQACSRYDYEEKLLSKVIRMEIRLENVENKTDLTYSQLMELTPPPSATPSTTTETMGVGSTYVRWGRRECGGENNQLAYKGYTGGSSAQNTGAAVDFLCLPEEPEWDRYDDAKGTDNAYVYGAEYQTNNNRNIFDRQDMYTFSEDAPCAVCWVNLASVFMIPGKMTCPAGWSKQYNGYLAAGKGSHLAGSQYICLDSDFEFVAGGEENENGKLIYIAEARCGSLKCPPYVDGREMTCVVCSR